MTKISEILAKVETDKISFHQYGTAYDDIFSKFDRLAPLNILEVGTQKGGSLLAWKEYFPNANVYGVDIIDVVLDKYRTDTVTRIISDIKDWKNDIEWDIVIDDGSHWLPDVIYVISQYSAKLKDKGVIVIEDVRFPNLLWAVMQNILDDMRIVYPDYPNNIIFEVKGYDGRKIGNETSYMMVITKRKFEEFYDNQGMAKTI